uniref:Uncharacterized protein n=1 Tax=Caenorhabditis japonica TaxID=281687 RepID=A0A8R1ITA2_CAEJA
MDEVGDQPPEITVHIVKTDPDEQLEPDAKRVNFIGTSSEQVFDDDEQNPSPIVDDFYEPIDPSEPSTSSLPVTPILRIADKFQFITNVGQNGSPPAGRNRLRAPRNTSLQIAEAAQKNGMQTVNRSGSRFVVPITMQAHPTPLTDRLLDERDDILSQQEAYPYCILCNCIIKTWRGFEYHVLRMHIKYRAFRCFHCQKESFYTEEEGRFHLSIYHPGDEVIQ